MGGYEAVVLWAEGGAGTGAARGRDDERSVWPVAMMLVDRVLGLVVDEGAASGCFDRQRLLRGGARVVEGDGLAGGS